MSNRAEYPETRCCAIRIVLVLAVCFVATATATSSAYAQTLTTLYNFTGGLDGGLPAAGLALDAANNLYGTTASGGVGSCKAKGLGVGCGLVFKMDKTGKETVLYSFPGTGARGANPIAGPLRKANGYLYGTTMNGGSIGCNGEKGCGVLFSVSTTKVETTLHNFGEGTDGQFPGGLIQDASGNLYGITGWGGSSSCNEGGGTGCGTVFELTSAGAESVLYRFTGAEGDGAIPLAGLVEDGQHNLYGVTEHGGNSGCNNGDGEGCGTVFKLDDERRESVLYAFTGSSDGANPFAGLVEDASGDLYGTTAYGGDLNCNPPTGCGTVFVLSKAGHETVLHNFTGAEGDGAIPYAGLLLDARGKLYGTTYAGGDLDCNPPNGCGTVFELDKSGKETVLHTFAGPDGAGPYLGVLVRDAEGNLYGTTFGGGTHGYGTVFKLTPRQ
jgi:uncharacterized repeat protein (TIGR03803 family)